MSDTQLNRSFLIRTRMDGEVQWKLHSAGTYRKMVGEKVAESHFSRALKSRDQRIPMRLRRGADVLFINR